MIFKKSISVFIISCCFFKHFTKQDEYLSSSQTNQLIADVIFLKESLASLISDVDSLHDKLNGYTNLAMDLKRNVLLIKNTTNQCDTVEKFLNDINSKLLDMQQNIQKTLSESNSQYTKKIDTISQSIYAPNECPADNRSDYVIEIKNRINERLEEYDKNKERFTILEEKLNVCNTQLKSKEMFNHKSQDFSNILMEIHNKLNSQEEKLKIVEQHWPKLQNVASMVENHTSSRKSKSTCKRETCILYSDFNNTSKAVKRKIIKN